MNLGSSGWATIARYGVALATAVSGYVHADLYVHGYRYIAWIGPLFLIQAAGSFAVAILLSLSGSPVLRLGAAGLAAGALTGFTLSRTVGVFGFTERGWQPAPQAALTVATELTVVLLLGLTTWRQLWTAATGRNSPAAVRRHSDLGTKTST